MTTAEGHFFSSCKIIQTLSIDVVLGSLSVAFFAMHLLGVDANHAWWFILPMAVWSLYTFDHLIDGINSKGNAVISRHSYHYRHRKILGALAGLLGLTAFFLSLVFLNQHIIIIGLLIGLVVMIYFTVLYFYAKQKPVLLQKELIIAVVYVCGIWLAPLVWYNKLPGTFILIVLTVSVLLAWAEGIMASWFDFENDVKDGHGSFTILFGKKNSRRFLILVHIIVFLMIKVSIFLISTNLQFAALMILALMNLLLLLTMLFPEWFQKHERYRMIGESIFLLPALVAFF
jgi:4-hydroxybenzoate polyprenyltransferase